MKRALTAQEMHEVEASAVVHGTSLATLMENAGDALAKEAMRVASREGRVLVLCGPGNNGGDGLVAAKTLASNRRTVFVESLIATEQLRDEPAKHARALRDLGVAVAPIPQSMRVDPGDVVIDALLGTGVSRAPEGAMAETIGRIAKWREQGAKVVSADLPFAQQHFCSVENTHNVKTLSMMRDRDFAKDYGVLLLDGLYRGITARAQTDRCRSA